MKIIVPDNWAGLMPWQQREIIHIIQNKDTEDFTEQNIRIVQILLMKGDNVSEEFRWLLYDKNSSHTMKIVPLN